MAADMRSSLLTLLAVVLVALLALAAFVWSGIYDVGADAPHTRPVHALLEMLRQRSVAVRADDMRVVDLADEALIRQGAGNYDAMCTGCHLAPGMAESELSRGLYPAPPPLAESGIGDPARAFWVVKHGIKATGMPAWGKSMADEYIWGMVAFLQQLPKLDPAGYRELVASSGGHEHGGGAAAAHDEAGSGAAAEPTVATTVHRHSDGSAHVHAAEPALEVPAAARPAVAVVDAFGAALARGDFATIESLLDPGVIVLEGGAAERSRAEYLREHARSDARFLAGAKVTLERRTARVEGDAAWVTSVSEIRTVQKGEPLALLSAETMLLRGTPQGWRIAHIHWSSSPKRNVPGEVR